MGTLRPKTLVFFLMQDDRYQNGKFTPGIQLGKCMNTLQLTHHTSRGGSSWWRADHVLSAFSEMPNTLNFILTLYSFYLGQHLNASGCAPYFHCIIDPSSKILFLSRTHHREVRGQGQLCSLEAGRDSVSYWGNLGQVVDRPCYCPFSTLHCLVCQFLGSRDVAVLCALLLSCFHSSAYTQLWSKHFRQHTVSIVLYNLHDTRKGILWCHYGFFGDAFRYFTEINSTLTPHNHRTPSQLLLQ